MSRAVRNMTMASGASVSAALDLAPAECVVGFQVSATFDTTTTLTLTGTVDGSATYVAVKSSAGTAYTITVLDDTGGYYYIDPTVTFGLASIKLTSDTTQGAAETIRVVTVQGI